MEINKIATIKTDFDSKFGIPRQSGRICTAQGTIVFEKDFQNPDFIKDIEQFSHLWLIWGFSENKNAKIHPTVRPPRLGGNKRVGVFASRSPFRPNSLGMSCVKLDNIIKSENGFELIVSGVDLLNNTPIYDIKPYIPYTDCICNAKGGYAEENKDYRLTVNFQNELLNIIPKNKQQTVFDLLADDPRPSYQHDSNRIYGFDFAGYNIKFKVNENILTVTSVTKNKI